MELKFGQMKFIKTVLYELFYCDFTFFIFSIKNCHKIIIHKSTFLEFLLQKRTKQK